MFSKKQDRFPIISLVMFIVGIVSFMISIPIALFGLSKSGKPQEKDEIYK